MKNSLKLNIIESYNIYEFVDPDTGVHYLMYKDTRFNEGMSGLTPRLNADGSLMVDKKHKK